MIRGSCPEGKIWDNLLRTCINRGAIPTRQLQPPTESILTAAEPLTAATTSRAKATDAPNVLVLNQTLWISVILVTLGAILALTLWLVIFRRQTKASRDKEDPVHKQEVLQKKEPAAQFDRNNGEALRRAADGSSPCHPLNQMNPEWEDGFSMCSDPSRHGGKEDSGALPACTAMADHRIPLPATELGGTALVTTKTV